MVLLSVVSARRIQADRSRQQRLHTMWSQVGKPRRRAVEITPNPRLE